MDLWAPPPAWGLGAHAKHLKNLYVFFWQWAAWKVFGSGHAEATGEADVHRPGIVCYITTAGFLNGPGFQHMRADLRASCSDIWVIDGSPEGHQPAVNTRLFQGVQQEVCVVLALRRPHAVRGAPARIRYRALLLGHREDKFAALATLSLMDDGWQDGETSLRGPFLPLRGTRWDDQIALSDLFEWYTPGMISCRTWVVAPDAKSLGNRWDELKSARDKPTKEALFHPDRDRTLDRLVSVDLGAFKTRSGSVDADKGPLVTPVRYGYRSFDRQWIIPDHRLLSQGRPAMWAAHSNHQIYLTVLDAHSPSDGPAATFTDLINDKHHFMGSFGGRSLPLWRDAAATVPNVKAALLAHLSTAFKNLSPPPM